MAASRIGKDNPNWKGGMATLIKIIRNTRKYSIWKNRVRRRDRRLCQNCKATRSETHSHHIISIKQIVRDNGIKTLEEAYFCPELWNVDNGETLCFQCHKATDTYGSRSTSYQIYA